MWWSPKPTPKAIVIRGVLDMAFGILSIIFAATGHGWYFAPIGAGFIFCAICRFVAAAELRGNRDDDAVS